MDQLIANVESALAELKAAVLGTPAETETPAEEATEPAEAPVSTPTVSEPIEGEVA